MGYWFLLTGLLFATAIGQAVDHSVAPKPSVELANLEKSLDDELQARGVGRVSLENHRDWLVQFHKELESASAKLPSSPANIALHAKILSRLGDPGLARGMLDRALQKDPGNTILRTAVGYTQFDQKNYTAAEAAADAVLRKEPGNKDALWLKHVSEGRRIPKSESPATAKQAAANPGAFAENDEKNLPMKLAFKMPPKTMEMPALISEQAAPAGHSSAWWLLTLPVGIGIAGYGIQRGRQTLKSEEAPQPISKPPNKKGGHLLRNCAIVAGAIALGAILWECAPVIIEMAEGLIAASVPPAQTMIPAMGGFGSSGGAVALEHAVAANAAKAAVAATAMVTVTNAVANRSHSSAESGNSNETTNLEKTKTDESVDSQIPSDSELEEAAERLDPVDKGGKLTKAGRSLAKHNSDKRPGSANLRPDGSPTDINQAGKKLVDSILKDLGRTNTMGESKKYGKIIDIRRSDGVGLRVKANGEFLYFIE